mmetsp:Transcript_125108/g.365386  ORF Transcript_125108/g.365386 Transcript_125108/m.365386 type:complete len:236 (+) Transcript_125108:1742-2449(+)
MATSNSPQALVAEDVGIGACDDPLEFAKDHGKYGEVRRGTGKCAIGSGHRREAPAGPLVVCLIPVATMPIRRSRREHLDHYFPRHAATKVGVLERCCGAEANTHRGSGKWRSQLGGLERGEGALAEGCDAHDHVAANSLKHRLWHCDGRAAVGHLHGQASVAQLRHIHHLSNNGRSGRLQGQEGAIPGLELECKIVLAHARQVPQLSASHGCRILGGGRGSCRGLSDSGGCVCRG